jgi:hypothetical protein
VKIIWYQNDLQIELDERRFASINENKYSLIITECDLSDSGEYKAMLTNNYGQVECKCRLNVLQNISNRNRLSRNSPNFVELLKDAQVIKGNDVCFKCKVTGFPQPEIAWFKDGQELLESAHIKVSSSLETRQFLFISFSSQITLS